MIVKPISDISYFTEEFGYIDGPYTLKVNWHTKQTTDQFDTATTFVAQFYDCVVHSTPPLLVTKNNLMITDHVWPYCIKQNLNHKRHTSYGHNGPTK